MSVSRRVALASGSAALALLTLTRSRAADALDRSFSDPQDVAIRGYIGDAMEPFLSRDGTLLLFNNRNAAPQNTDLHWAKRIDDLTFDYQGKIEGVNTPALEGTPSMDASGELYFVSTRSYRKTAATVYRAHFANGVASEPELVPGVSRNTPGWVNFDLEISADGNTLVFVDGWFGAKNFPQSAALVIALRDGGGFRRSAESDTILSAINRGGIVYAPCLSANLCELFFTRVAAMRADAKPAIYRASRQRPDLPFGAPARIAAINEFAEGPTISPDSRRLYFHVKRDDRFLIRLVRREKVPQF
jgi:hypothetical protein